MAADYFDTHGIVVDLVDFKRYGSTTFYSNPNLNSLLGMADHVIVHAIVNESGGTTPTLTVVAEDSADGENWADLNNVILGVSISSTPITLRGAATFPHARYLRFRCTVGGTVPHAIMTLRATLKENT